MGDKRKDGYDNFLQTECNTSDGTSTSQRRSSPHKKRRTNNIASPESRDSTSKEQGAAGRSSAAKQAIQESNHKPVLSDSDERQDAVPTLSSSRPTRPPSVVWDIESQGSRKELATSDRETDKGLRDLQANNRQTDGTLILNIPANKWNAAEPSTVLQDSAYIEVLEDSNPSLDCRSKQDFTTGGARPPSRSSLCPSQSISEVVRRSIAPGFAGPSHFQIPEIIPEDGSTDDVTPDAVPAPGYGHLKSDTAMDSSYSDFEPVPVAQIPTGAHAGDNTTDTHQWFDHRDCSLLICGDDNLSFTTSVQQDSICDRALNLGLDFYGTPVMTDVPGPQSVAALTQPPTVPSILDMALDTNDYETCDLWINDPGNTLAHYDLNFRHESYVGPARSGDWRVLATDDSFSEGRDTKCCDDESSLYESARRPSYVCYGNDPFLYTQFFESEIGTTSFPLEALRHQPSAIELVDPGYQEMTLSQHQAPIETTSSAGLLDTASEASNSRVASGCLKLPTVSEVEEDVAKRLQGHWLPQRL